MTDVEVRHCRRWNIDDAFTLSGSYTDSKMKTGTANVHGFPLSQADALAPVSTPRHAANLRLDWQTYETLATYVRATIAARTIRVSTGVAAAIP